MPEEDGTEESKRDSDETMADDSVYGECVICMSSILYQPDLENN